MTKKPHTPQKLSAAQRAGLSAAASWTAIFVLGPLVYWGPDAILAQPVGTLTILAALAFGPAGGLLLVAQAAHSAAAAADRVDQFVARLALAGAASPARPPAPADAQAQACDARPERAAMLHMSTRLRLSVHAPVRLAPAGPIEVALFPHEPTTTAAFSHDDAWDRAAARRRRRALANACEAQPALPPPERRAEPETAPAQTDKPRRRRTPA